MAAITRSRGILTLLLVGSLAGQIYGLYAPSSPGSQTFVHEDKVVHFLLFAVPTALGLIRGLPRRGWPALMAAHAVASEVIQKVLLPHRSGDPADALIDIVGVLCGVFVARQLGSRDRAGQRPS